MVDVLGVASRNSEFIIVVRLPKDVLDQMPHQPEFLILPLALRRWAAVFEYFVDVGSVDRDLNARYGGTFVQVRGVCGWGGELEPKK